MDVAFMSLEHSGWNDMNAASLSYEEADDPVSAVTAALAG
jgi:hypothetical protein